MGLTFAIAIAVALGILGTIILIAVNRRLRIFTRGTLAFMATTLMITTAISLVSLGNEVRNKEWRARRDARENAAASFARSWLEGAGDRVLMPHVKSSRFLDDVHDVTRRIDRDVAALYRRRREQASTVTHRGTSGTTKMSGPGAIRRALTPAVPRLADFTLALLQIRSSTRWWTINPFGGGEDQWRFRAVLEGAGDIVIIEGHLVTESGGSSHAVRRLDVDKVDVSIDHVKTSTKWLCVCRERAAFGRVVYRNPLFRYSGGHLVRIL